LTVLGDDLVGRGHDGAHGVAVGVVEWVINVVTVAMGRISGGHVKKFDRFFSLFMKRRGRTQFPQTAPLIFT
jgi:hypothetical protein